MAKIWRVYSGADGQSHIAEETLPMKPFLDTEGAHGETTPMQPTITHIIPGFALPT